MALEVEPRAAVVTLNSAGHLYAAGVGDGVTDGFADGVGDAALGLGVGEETGGADGDGVGDGAGWHAVITAITATRTTATKVYEILFFNLWIPPCHFLEPNVCVQLVSWPPDLRATANTAVFVFSLKLTDKTGPPASQEGRLVSSQSRLGPRTMLIILTSHGPVDVQSHTNGGPNACQAFGHAKPKERPWRTAT